MATNRECDGRYARMSQEGSVMKSPMRCGELRGVFRLVHVFHVCEEFRYLLTVCGVCQSPCVHVRTYICVYHIVCVSTCVRMS